MALIVAGMCKPIHAPEDSRLPHHCNSLRNLEGRGVYYFWCVLRRLYLAVKCFVGIVPFRHSQAQSLGSCEQHSKNT